MAEYMAIVDASGREIGTVVVETPEQQEEIGRILAAQGYRLQEPSFPPDLERGGDLEAGECKEDLPPGEVDNCAIAVSVSYAEDAARRFGMRVPKLRAIVQARRLEGSAQAREAMEELVEEARTFPLTPEQAKELRAYVEYGFPDLAGRLPG